MPKTIAVKKATDTTFILVRAGQMLMQLREDKPGIRHPGTWNFPGGGMKAGETAIDCIIREVKEETGLVVSAADCQFVTFYCHDIGYDKAEGDLDHVVLAHLPDDAEIAMWKGKPLEGEAMKFMTLAEIKGLKLSWNQETLLPLLEEVDGE